jgi:glycosyltransferase involved in cell wall biosynthesis
LITIVIPTRNRLRYLQEAIESVRRQTCRNWELVVVDDASNDGTWAWLDSLCDPRIRAVQLKARSERSAARNRGLAEATGAYVLFLDDDDRLRARALEELATALVRHPEALAAVGAHCVFDDTGQSRRGSWHPPFETTGSVWTETVLGWAARTGGTLFRTDALRALGGWDTSVSFAEDHRLWLRLSRAGSVVLTPAVVMDYRAHAGQTRPDGSPELDAAARRDLIASLPASERASGGRLLEARIRLLEAAAAYARDSYASALKNTARAIAIYPRLLLSVLAGPPIVALGIRCVAASVLGPALWIGLRRFAVRMRHAVGRAPAWNRH